MMPVCVRLFSERSALDDLVPTHADRLINGSIDEIKSNQSPFYSDAVFAAWSTGSRALKIASRRVLCGYLVLSFYGMYVWQDVDGVTSNPEIIHTYHGSASSLCLVTPENKVIKYE